LIHFYKRLSEEGGFQWEPDHEQQLSASR